VNEIITSDYFAVAFVKQIYEKALGSSPRIIFDKSQARRKSLVTDLFKLEYPFVVVSRESIEVMQNRPFFLTFTRKIHNTNVSYRAPIIYKINYKAYFYLLKETEVTQILSNVRTDIILQKANSSTFDIVVENRSDRMINPSTDELVFVAEIDFHTKNILHLEKHEETPTNPHLKFDIKVEESVSKEKSFFKRKRKIV